MDRADRADRTDRTDRMIQREGTRQCPVSAERPIGGFKLEGVSGRVKMD